MPSTSMCSRVARLAALTAALVSLAATPAAAAPTPLKVVTQNLDGGARDGVLSAAGWQAVKADDFPSRAQAIAGEIAAEDPDLISLQEVARWTATGAGEPSYDYLALVLGALGERGLGYFVGALSTTADTGPVDLASASSEPFSLRFEDRDVILVRDRAGLAFADPRHGTFAVGSGGWTSVDGVVGDRAFRFVDTRLDADPAVSSTDADELLAGPLAAPGALIVAGDLGAAPDGGATTAYASLTETLTDVWLRGAGSSGPGRRQPGFTCCQAPDLRNARSALDQRSDLVLTSGGQASGTAKVVGDRRADRTPAGLWPSDHAGLVATVYP